MQAEDCTPSKIIDSFSHSLSSLCVVELLTHCGTARKLNLQMIMEWMNIRQNIVSLQRLKR